MPTRTISWCAIHTPMPGARSTTAAPDGSGSIPPIGAAAVTTSGQSQAGRAALGRPLDRSWQARLDAVRILWYRRIVSFDQRTQIALAAFAQGNDGQHRSGGARGPRCGGRLGAALVAASLERAARAGLGCSCARRDGGSGAVVAPGPAVVVAHSGDATPRRNRSGAARGGAMAAQAGRRAGSEGRKFGRVG